MLTDNERDEMIRLCNAIRQEYDSQKLSELLDHLLKLLEKNQSRRAFRDRERIA